MLKAILGTHKYVIDDNFIHIYTGEEFNSLQSQQKTNPNTETGEKPAGQVEGAGKVGKADNLASENLTAK